MIVGPLVLCAAWLAAAERVALVIGNGAYTATTRLENPPNNASDMVATLRRVGFEVVEVLDGDRRGMMAAIREFGDRAAGAETALFYCAGHGLQVGDTNYMLPVSVAQEGTAVTTLREKLVKIGAEVLSHAGSGRSMPPAGTPCPCAITALSVGRNQSRFNMAAIHSWPRPCRLTGS
jgi:hypothetical protein